MTHARNPIPRRILCAVDLAPGGLQVARWAAVLAARVGAELELAHVVPRLPQLVALSGEPDLLTIPGWEPVAEAWRGAAAIQLEALAADLPHDVEHLHVLDGPVLSALEALVETRQIDALVVGDRGAGARSSYPIGAVAERLVRHFPVPVTVVKIDQEQTPEPPPKVVLACVDLTREGRVAAPYAEGWAERLGAALHIVHVVPDLSWLPPSLRSDRVDLETDRAVILDAAERGLEVLSNSLNDDPAGVHLREGTPAEQILAVAEEIGADLIVVGTRGRVGLQRVLLGSVAQRVVRLSAVPITVVRWGERED